MKPTLAHRYPRAFVTGASLGLGAAFVRMLLAEKPWSRISLIAAALTGDLRRSFAYEECSVERMRIRARSESLRLARDGETCDASREFFVEKAPKRLTVFVPHG